MIEIEKHEEFVDGESRGSYYLIKKDENYGYGTWDLKELNELLEKLTEKLK